MSEIAKLMSWLQVNHDYNPKFEVINDFDELQVIFDKIYYLFPVINELQLLHNQFYNSVDEIHSMYKSEHRRPYLWLVLGHGIESVNNIWRQIIKFIWIFMENFSKLDNVWIINNPDEILVRYIAVINWIILQLDDMSVAVKNECNKFMSDCFENSFEHRRLDADNLGLKELADLASEWWNVAEGNRRIN